MATYKDDAIHPWGGELVGGITKREYISALLLQGLFTQSHYANYPAIAADMAVSAADELIDTLNREIK